MTEKFNDQRAIRDISYSMTEQIQIIMPYCINGAGRLFGGKLMEWIDVVAAVVARRHSGCDITTVSVDNLTFSAPAFINDTIILRGKITYVGNTSMEVCVETFVEALSGVRRAINKAYLVMVAVDGNGDPIIVPRLELKTDEERDEWERGKKRNILRKERRAQNY